ncbi:MAG: SPFH domain-containing protein [Burkholderiales bacterium]
MKLTMPLLALLVAILLVASQAIYTVEQTKYAIKFQLGEIIEVNTEAGLYFKVPLVQNVRYYDRRNLLLENADVDRVVTSEKTPLEVDFVVFWRIVDVKQYYVAVQGNEDLARGRLAQTVRSNLAEEFNKATMHEAISTGRERIMNETRQKADLDARNIGIEVVDVRQLRRLALPARTSRGRSTRGWNRSAGASPASARSAQRNRRRSAPTPAPPAPGDPRRRVPAGADQGRGRRQGVRHLRGCLLAESRILRVLPQPRGVQGDLPRPQRHAGARPVR